METIKTPTILSVKDDKHHIISHTVIDHERIEEVLGRIRDILSRNNWHHEITVAPSERYFLFDLTIKDLKQWRGF